MLIPPGVIVIDGISMFAVANSLGSELHIWVPCNVSGVGVVAGFTSLAPVLGRGGHCYSIWYPLLPVLAAPLAGLGHVLAHLAGVRAQNVAEVLALSVPALAAAGAATLTAMIASKLGASRRGAVAAALALAFGTETLTYARSFFAETLAAFLVALAVWGITEPGRRRYLGYAGIALGIVARPQVGLVGPALGLIMAIKERRPRALLGPLAATAAGLGLYLVYNWARFADLSDFGGGPQLVSAHNYLSPHAVTETLGLLLLSPGKGLLWYSPVVIPAALLLWRLRRTALGAMCILGSVAILLAFISYIDPRGGRDWGDRDLVAALPLLCAALGTARGRVAAIASVLALVGLVSQIPTTLAFYDRTYAEHEEKGVNIAHDRWSVANSPLFNAWPAMVHQLRDASRSDARQLANSAGPAEAHSIRDIQLYHTVAMWWWLLPAVGIPWWSGAILAVVVIAGGVVLVLRVAAPRDGPAAAGVHLSFRRLFTRSAA